MQRCSILSHAMLRPVPDTKNANHYNVWRVSFIVTPTPTDRETAIEAVDLQDRSGCVRSVSLNIYRGRLHLIVGVNGGGKTQLLRLLAGEEAPTGGRVASVGSRLFLGPQSLLESATIADEFARFGLVGQVLSSISSLVYELKLPSAETPIEHLSPGQRQRLLLAIASGSNAQIVLLDSPTSALDAAGRDLASSAIESIVASGRTVVATTVDPELVLMDSERIWIGDGHIVRQRGYFDVP